MSTQIDTPGPLEQRQLYMVLCPAGHLGVWLDFRITEDAQDAMVTAGYIGGLVVTLPVVHDASRKENG